MAIESSRRLVWLVGCALGTVIVCGTALYVTISGRRDTLQPGEPARTPRPEASVPAEPLDAEVTVDVADAIATQAFAAKRSMKQRADLDPQQDGWRSEVVSQLAAQQLSDLAALLKHPEDLSSSSLTPIVATDFSCGPLLAHRTDTLLENTTFRITRDVVDQTALLSMKGGGFEKEVGFQAALQPLFEPFQGTRELRVKFKLVNVKLLEQQIVTRQLLDISAYSPGGMLQQNAIWLARWSRPTDGRKPRLHWVGVEYQTQVTTRTPSTPLYQDCTASILGQSAAYREQLIFGIDHWLQRLEAQLTGPFGHHGLAVGDVDNDGLDDVYFCQPGGLPNLLYRQARDATATDVSHAAKVDVLDFSRSALFVDLDNDGDQDLVVATLAHLLVFANDGEANFSMRARIDDVRDAHSLTAADYDNDGRLDLYVCVYSGDGGKSRGAPAPIPIHDARNGGRNVLLRNDGASPDMVTWKFLDVTSQVGLEQANRRWSYAASWEDYDVDGDVDLYVANDFGRNVFYRNEGGQFVDASAEAGLSEAAFGMSVSWGDYDADGRMDIYVSNMYSGAGNRITTQPNFQPAATRDVKRTFRYAARGNSLFQSQGDGSFRDVSADAGVTMGRWAWSSLFTDVNNDGHRDLLVGNGFLTRDDPDDL